MIHVVVVNQDRLGDELVVPTGAWRKGTRECNRVNWPCSWSRETMEAIRKVLFECLDIVRMWGTRADAAVGLIPEHHPSYVDHGRSRLWYHLWRIWGGWEHDTEERTAEFLGGIICATILEKEEWTQELSSCAPRIKGNGNLIAGSSFWMISNNNQILARLFLQVDLIWKARSI